MFRRTTLVKVVWMTTLVVVQIAARINSQTKQVSAFVPRAY